MEPIVQTADGPVIGVVDNGMTVWRGLPYAKPPVGALRFAPPVPPEPWQTPRDASRFGGRSIQTTYPGETPGKLSGSEDCLSLNVWSPSADGAGRPVLVWIHGGGFAKGSGMFHDGGPLARRGDVVVVTINYRLGPWGFLYIDGLSVNPALQDAVAALSWIARNIAGFGGDPDNVTVLGESAGAMLIGTLLGVPAASGLFHRAFLSSGAARNVREPAAGTLVADHILASLGLVADQAERLRDLSADDIFRAAARAADASSVLPLDAEAFLPVIDGTILPRHPIAAVAAGQARHIPLLISTCRDEMNLFLAMSPTVADGKERFLRHVLGDAAADRLTSFYGNRSDLLTALMFGIPAIRLAEAQIAAGGAAWMMRLDYAVGLPPFDRVGPAHAADLPLIWENYSFGGPTVANGGSTADRAMATRLQDILLNFARTGRPQSADLPDWPVYQTDTRPTLLLDTVPRVVSDPAGDRRRLWDDLPAY